jgi:hypothetical protein
MTERKRYPLKDNPHAPEVFASGVSGYLAIGNTIVITLECGKSDYSAEQPDLTRHVVGRLLMSPAGAHSLAVGLFDYLKTNGLIPSAPERAAN